MATKTSTFATATVGDDLDLVIVGAGIAGLQALQECQQAGLKAVVLERDAVPGGKWSGHGIYDCVQIQQHKHDFFIPGVPWPEGTPACATRDDMVSATLRYITEHKLQPHIVCRSKVNTAVFDETAGVWTTTTADGAAYKSRYIVWAVGTLGPPNVPQQVRTALTHFEGNVVHSHAYFRPHAYEGQKVVVLGYGASSVEIAQDLARNGNCASVTLVAPPKVQADGQRNGQDWCLSRDLPGDGSRFCSQGQSDAKATLEARNATVGAAMAERHPKYPECMPPVLRPSGELDGPLPVYPGMDGRPLGGRVIVSEGFLDGVSDGSIHCLPGYLGTSGAAFVTVVHEGSDDVTLDADAVVVCTGYEPPTRRIASAMTPAPADCETLYKGMWMADVPNAALVGHVYGFVAVPPFAGQQAKFLARVVSGAEALPPSSHMLSWVESVKDKYCVTQRLSENAYYAELRKANLGEDVMAKSPVGPGPPLDPTQALAAASSNFIPEADDGVASAADEALFYLDESRAGAAGSAPIRVLGIGDGRAEAIVQLLETRLRPAEAAMLAKASAMPLPLDAEDGTAWRDVADGSVDLALGHGLLFPGSAPAVKYSKLVGEIGRVLAPGGHAVMMLEESEEGARALNAASLMSALDAHERASGCARTGLRLVHKSQLRAHVDGYMYRQYVYRATPATTAGSPPAPAEPMEVPELFRWAGDFYTSMQGTFGAALEAVFNRRRDESIDCDDVCGEVVATADMAARFDGRGLIPETGLVRVDSLGPDGRSKLESASAVGSRAGSAFADGYLAELEQTVVKSELRLQAGNYIGHMAGALPPWAAPVERLVTFLHCNNVKVETAKTTTYLERSTMAQIHRAFYNFSDDFYTEHSMNDSTCLGQPTSGGTVANLQALWTARNTASLATGDAKDGVILASQYAHYSVSKALDVLGLGEAGLVTVPTTDFKMDVGALKTALEGLQRSNRKVLAIVAIAGTTEAGAFDPIREIADLGKKYGAWVHVDAAWAGGLIFAPTARNLFDGIELADSITVDAHKSLFAPMGFGMALYRSPYAARAITKEAEYIIRKGEPDLGKFSLEGSRSAQALHLHACLAALGRSGLSAVAEHKLHVTRAFAALIEADPAFELFAQPESDILLFRARKPFANTYVHDVSDNSSDLDLQRRQDEEHEQELDDLNTRLHAAQKLQGRTFVSRTAVMDPRRDKAGSGKVARSTKTKVLRVVVNAQVTLENCSAVLEDLRLISTCLALDPAPLDEARTLVQTLAHSVIHAPHSVAVRTADLKLPLSASANGQVAAAKAFADAIPESETGKGTAGVGSLTYWQLMREALHVSAHLTQTAPGGVVPIMCGRNVDAYVAVVATLLRGATWLLIDSSLPPQRISHFIAEATPGCELLVSDNCMAACESAQAILIAKGQTRTLYTRSLTTILRDLRADESATGVSPLVMSRPPTPTPPRLAAQSDAYMIFTSGSTGLPKAVKIAHLQLCDLLRAFAERWGGRMTCGKDSALAQISWAWDMHVLDMWLPLSQGATVRLLREEERLDGARVAAAIDRTAAEAAERDGHLRWIQGTPTFYRTVLGGGWLGDGGSGLTLISSGEPMPADLARSLLLRCHTLVNCYGLTECTIFQAFEQLTLPTSVQTDGVARDAETGVLRLPDISCGRACYSYENDDKCEVVLCRVAASELSAASAELDESTNEFATAEDDGLRRAKAVKNGLKLERVEGTDVVGQVCFAGTCLPRQGYHNAQELNDAKFLDYSMLQEVGGPTTATTASLRKNEANDSMASMTSVASTGSTDLSSSWLQVSSSASDGDSGDRAPPPPRRMMLSGDLGKWRADGKLQILGRVDGIVKVLGSRVDLSEAETALRQLETHVSDAAVVAVDDPTNDDKTSSKVLVAYFVPTVQANAQAAQDGLAAIADEVDLWESIYDDAYSKKDALGAAHDENHARDAKGEQGTNYDDELAGLTAEDMITNWSAYISSYTDKLWPRSTIEHWVNATVDRFLDMKPKRILELGSGNGMLAYRAALRPEVEEVWMADLSSEASRYVERLRVHPHFAHIAHKCKVLHRPADDFKDIPDNHFDCVAMNAMVMYFPSVEYMTDVLRKCSKCLRPGGSVYIGCCRSLEHLQHFHTDVTLFNATNDDAPALELRRACLQRRAKEKELLLSPDYFYRHAKTMPGCFDKVAILLRRGYDCPKTDEKGADPRHADAPVEMTRWRYDVFLLKGSLPAEDGVAVPKGKIPTLDSTERLRMIRQHNFEGEKTLHEAVDSLMRPADKGSADAILVRNVPNARVLDAVACELVIDQVIAEGERCGTPSTVGGVRRAIKNKIQQLAASNGGVGVCPEAFLEYVERVGEGRLGAQMMFTPHATSDTNMAASGTNAAAHLFDVTIYRLGNGGPPAMPLRECRFRTGELHTKVDYGRMQVAPLLSHLNMIELGGIQHRHQGGEGRHEECYGNKRGWGGVQKMLASSLRQTLPSFAMPTHYVPVDVLPLLPTGKTDKRNLPSAHAALVLRGSERNTAFRAPSTATERTLVAFFTQYISCNLEIGVDHDFGELGGNSLLAGRLVNACKRAFGVDLTMGAFFEKRTPAKIAAFIDEEMGSLSKDDQERLDAAAAAECTAQDVSPASKSHGISVYDTFIPVPATPGAAAGGGSTILLHARVWRPTIVPTNGHVALVDFAPYPLSFMTTHVDDATYYPLALRGLTCIRVSARGTDRSQGACGDPYDFAGVHTPDLTAVIDRIASTGLADGTAADGTTAPPVDAFGSVILHGFSWAATVALRVLALPDGVRPSAIKAACLCMGNDELHESDAFFERRVPLAFNWMWTSQFEALMARPPTDLANDQTTGATWQHQWLDRLEALGNLPAKYMCATRDPSRDARWKKQSLSGQADPALEGRTEDAALLKGLGKIAVPVLAAGASFLGRYGDTVERLVRSRGVAEASGRPLPEVKGIIGPWVHAFPHLSAVGPNVDWIGMVVDFAHRHTSSATPPPPESSLTYFETESIPLGPALPMRWPGHYRVVPARALAAHSATTPPVAPPAVLSATAAGTLVPRSEPLAAGVGTVPDAEVCGQMGGEWFSWGVNSDLPVDQSVDDARSLCFEMKPAAMGVDGLTVRGVPKVTLLLADETAHRALTAQTSGLDCIVARLCVVDETGASRLAALGTASLTLAEAVADMRSGARHDSMPLAKLELDLHFCALTLAPKHTLRLALSTSYFPLFLATGGCGGADLASVSLELPNIGGAPVELPPPALDAHPTTLQRVRMPRHERHALASGNFGAHTLQDDGTVRTHDGLSAGMRSEMYVEVLRGRRIAMKTTVQTTLSKGSEFAQLRVNTSLSTDHADKHNAIATTTVEAIACGAPLWSKTFTARIVI